MYLNMEEMDQRGIRMEKGGGSLTLQHTLLDALALQMDLPFLSDLQYLRLEQKKRLRQYLISAAPEKVPLHERNDAINYIAGQTLASNCRDAWLQLLTWLKMETEK